jgi:ubiquinone biosynthesis protein UbiJ
MDVPSLGSAAQSAIEGLKRAEEKTLQVAQNIAEGSLNPEDIVSLSLAAADFKANVAVLKSETEMTKSLLDIVA